MALIGALISFSPSTVVRSADVNQNFTDIRTAFNNTAVLTDVAKTITVSHTFSAPQLFASGTVAAPVIAFTGDAATGIYRIGASNIGVAAGGIKILDIAATGLTVVGAVSSTTGSITQSLTVGTTFNVTGNTTGVASFAGNRYSHCMVTAGYQNTSNPLNELHQVGFYSAVQGNSYARGVGSFVAGFETALGTNTAAGALEYAVSFSVGAFGVGAGSSVGRVIGFMPADETAGTAGNAAIAPFNVGTTFTGNWFIYYPNSRPTMLAGSLVVGNEIYRTVRDDYIRLAAGNAGGDGPTLLLYGPTHATQANKAFLSASAGLTITAPTAITGNSSVTGTFSVSGDFTLPSETYRSVNTDFARVSGGNGAGVGALLILYGGAHATAANQAQLTASAGLTITAATAITGNSSVTGTFSVSGALTATGGLTIGASQDVNLPGGGFGFQNASTRFLAVASGVNPALTFTSSAISMSGTLDVTGALTLGNADTRFNQPLVALGGGAAATFGTIGGSGPTVSAQNAWKRFVDSGGAAFWVPVWK